MLRTCLLSALAACLLPLTASALELAPVAHAPAGAPWDSGFASRQQRYVEAETKARLADKGRRAVKAMSPGMAFYDVTFYDLVLDLDPAAEVVTGTTTVVAGATAALAAMELDLMRTMTVTDARVGGVAAPFSRIDDVLTVTLDRTYLPGEFVTVEVDYHGDPGGDYFGWSYLNGSALVWTLSEPYGARHWWACKDVNTDKADSVKLHVTVPDPLIVASNGLLTGQTVPEPGRTTFHWASRYPIAPYLVSVTAHPFALVSDSYQPLDGGEPMPVENYLVPAYEEVAALGYAVTPAMITAFAQAFGEYPFVDEKYGHAHFPWGGGMEHQTCSSMYYGAYPEGLIAHELGHQWFGDLITCADFRHIWLNEGFATWTEAYWREVSQGKAGYLDEMDKARYYGPGTIYVEDPTDFWAIFDGDLSYNKASWVVHMLRWVMGDAAFFAGLGDYRAQHGFASADTEEFQAVMEAASGLDLESFFQQWIYGEFYPAYEVSWSGTPLDGATRVRVRIAQTQSGAGIFAMPLEIRCMDSEGQFSSVTVSNDQAVQWYTFDVPGSVIVVDLDPDGWVLCTKTSGGVSDVGHRPLAATGILGSAPNPFNPRTTLSWELAAAGRARVTIHDLRGRRVRTLVDAERPAGAQRDTWDGRDDGGRLAPAGAYFVTLRAAGETRRHKITLVK